jgi:serpin B
MMVLSLLKVGSSEITLDEFNKVIPFSDIQEIFKALDKSNECQIYNYIFTKIPLADPFKKSCIAQISDGINLKELNEIVTKKTNGLITNPFKPELISDTSVTILNIIYFKAKWVNIFNESETKESKFYFGDKTRMIPFMNNDYVYCYYFCDCDYKIMEMCYGTGNESESVFSFGIILPNDSYELPKITDSQLQYYISKLEKQKMDKITVPKFNVKEEMALNDTLIKIGLKSTFSESSNFHNMTEVPVFVSLIKQMVCLDVNEKGTEAGAITYGIIGQCGCNVKTEFIANHPFIYYLRYKPLNVILFLGKFE